MRYSKRMDKESQKCEEMKMKKKHENNDNFAQHKNKKKKERPISSNSNKITTLIQLLQYSEGIRLL